MARTNTLGNFLTDVADAIREKTGSEETIQASQFDTAISEIPAGADLSEYFNSNDVGYETSPPNFGTWVKCIKKTSPVVCNSTYLGQLFYKYPALEIDFTNINKQNITNTRYMFSGCIVKNLDLSNFDFSNVSACEGMFNGCKDLKKIDIRTFDFTKLTTFSNMFGSGASNGPANDCLIIVADQTQKDWLNTKFSRLTNVQTVEEYEASLNS